LYLLWLWQGLLLLISGKGVVNINCRKIIKFLILSRLGLHLPHQIDPNNSNAKWNLAESILIVTMNMQREFDFVNF